MGLLSLAYLGLKAYKVVSFLANFFFIRILLPFYVPGLANVCYRFGHSTLYGFLVHFE
jgi:hypothetical protein